MYWLIDWWMDGWINVKIDGWIAEWINESMTEWLINWMNGESINEWVYK